MDQSAAMTSQKRTEVLSDSNMVLMTAQFQPALSISRPPSRVKTVRMHSAIRPDHVAVITGAAYGGIGFAMAQKLLTEQLKVVLADNDAPNLERASKSLLDSGVPSGQFLTVETDVTSLDSCKQLADIAFSRYSGVDLLHLNAGRTGNKLKAWEDDGAVHKVNYGGVVNGARAFVDRMLEHRGGKPGLVLVTGSKQGITMPPATGAAYNVSKAAVKAYTEMLDSDLRNLPDSQMRAALMVPGWVFTKLTSGGKNLESDAQKPDGAWTPEQTVDYTLEKLAKGDFYIICVSCDWLPDSTLRHPSFHFLGAPPLDMPGETLWLRELPQWQGCFSRVG